MVAVAMVVSVTATVAVAIPPEEGSVVRVVDGDTIVATIGTAEERVRFLNVDTPEVGTCMAEQATEFTSGELPVGQAVVLRYDRELRDGYGRLLALVKPALGDWVSVSLAERGLGFPLSIAPNTSYYRRVLSAAGRAKRDRVGMFSPSRRCTPIARTRRANSMVTQAQTMPVRTRAQYDAATRKLNQAVALLALVSVSRYGVTSPYFGSYIHGLRLPVLRRAREVRAAKTRQWNMVQSATHNSDDDPTGSTNNDGWWPPGVSHSYTGPRCYEPGGVIWYPC